MVREQIAGRGIRDARVLAAMAATPRERFVDAEHAGEAYQDSPLAIAAGQTISQPYIVALMAEALELGPSDRVLEVGAGSGYAAAVLGAIVSEVYAVERHAELAQLAAQRLVELGMQHVHVRCGDGTLGWPEHAPYDAIVVSAGGPRLPPPLMEQLAIEGRLVMPVGDTPREQELVRARRLGPDHCEQESLGAVKFVPLVGAAGWPGTPPRGAW